MKLTGNLKTKVDAASSMEEKNDIIKSGGFELSESELDDVVGGIKNPKKTSTTSVLKERKVAPGSGSIARC